MTALLYNVMIIGLPCNECILMMLLTLCHQTYRSIVSLGVNLDNANL